MSADSSTLSLTQPNYVAALLSLWQTNEVDSAQDVLVYERIVSVAQSILTAHSVSVWWSNPVVQDQLHCLCSSDREKVGSLGLIGDLQPNWPQLKQSPIIVDALRRADSPVNPSNPTIAFSTLDARLMSNGVLYGFLRCERDSAYAWTESEQQFLTLLAEQVVHEHEHNERTQVQFELELMSQVFTSSKDAIVVMSDTGVVQKVNPAFSLITGFQPEEVLGHHYPTWVNRGGQTSVDYDVMCQLVKEVGHWQGELFQRRKGTESKLVWQTMLSVKDHHNHVTNYIAIETDLSSFKEVQARVHYLSHYDSLTGLANRVEFLDQLSHMTEVAQSSSTMVTVLCLDIDDFKKVNLSLGQSLGDQLLMSTATRLTQSSDAHGLWARLSADEFVYAILHERLDDIDDNVQRILSCLHQPFALGGQQIRLTASIGVAVYPQDALDGESLLRFAQIAMRVVKHDKGNGYRFFAPVMNSQAVERLLLENKLSTAVANGELLLNYQPQVSLETGHLVGLEALVRWQHPELGLVSPGVFIPLAEETGLIEEIGEWVLQAACAQLAEWRNKGFPVVTMAINVSAPQFVRSPLVQQVSQLLVRYDLPPQLIELELTERVVMNDPGHVKDVMTELSALGVQLSMDDFGTGYSSLSYLQKFSLNKLKVDMSFVRNIVNSKDDLAITKAIIQLGRSLELTVIAEGVETLEQKRILTQLGCHEGQGYYFAKPLSVEQINYLFEHPLSLAQGVLG